MIAVIAALPREVAGLVAHVKPEPVLRRQGVYLYRLSDRLVACAGMGGERATLAVRAALDAGGVTELVSAGLAGGCDPALAVGTVHEAAVVIDTLSGERFAGNGGVTLATTHTIASVREKQRLHASYGAGLVDMEASTVARLAQLRGLGFRAVKAVSDAHDFELESLARFRSAKGHFRTGAFAWHTAVRPARWRQAIALGRGSQRALANLTQALRDL